MLSAGWNISGIFLHAKGIKAAPKPAEPKPVKASREAEEKAESSGNPFKDIFVKDSSPVGLVTNVFRGVVALMCSPLLLIGHAMKKLKSKDLDPETKIAIITLCDKANADVLADLVKDKSIDANVRYAAYKKIKSFSFANMPKETARACFEAQATFIRYLDSIGCPSGTIKREINLLCSDINTYQHEPTNEKFSKEELEGFASHLPKVKGGSVKPSESLNTKGLYFVTWKKAEPKRSKRKNTASVVRIIDRVRKTHPWEFTGHRVVADLIFD